MTGGRKEFRGKETGATVKCQGQGKCLREDICKEKEQVPGARKEFWGKETSAEANCQEQGKNLGEKRWEQKQNAMGKERTERKRDGSKRKCQGQGKF